MKVFAVIRAEKRLEVLKTLGLNPGGNFGGSGDEVWIECSVPYFPGGAFPIGRTDINLSSLIERFVVQV